MLRVKYVDISMCDLINKPFYLEPINKSELFLNTYIKKQGRYVAPPYTLTFKLCKYKGAATTTWIYQPHLVSSQDLVP